MKILCVLILVFLILFIGFQEIMKERNTVNTLDEIVKLVSFLKSELYYRTSDFYSLCDSAEKNGFRYIDFSENKIILNRCKDESITKNFNDFTARIGTTDSMGQIALCDEYLTRFSEKFKESKIREKDRIQINAALSMLAAITVIIFFI